MKVCLIDAFYLHDPALINSHWVAERTAIALRERFDAEVEYISGDDVGAVSVAQVLEAPFDGYAYFGHGRESILYRRTTESGEPIPVFDLRHIEQIGARWFHAFACLSGRTLCLAAASAGTAAYLGYRVQVVVEWEISQLPNELVCLLHELVTIASLALAEGDRSRNSIRRKIYDVSQRFLEWMDVNWERCLGMPWIQQAGLQKLANLLHMDMVLEGSDVIA